MRLWQQIFDKAFDKDLVYPEFKMLSCLRDCVEPNSKYIALLVVAEFRTFSEPADCMHWWIHTGSL